MTHAFLAALLLITCSVGVISQEAVRAKTDSGREVILNADGTWKYAAEPPAPKPTATGFNKPSSATTLYKSDRGEFSVWYDDTKWQLASKASDPEPGRRTFNLMRGDGYAVIIGEEISMPLANLKKVALQNVREIDPNAKIIFEEPRTVNGKNILCMKIDLTVEQIPIRYFGYYYGGKQGTVQFLTYTAQNLFEKYEPDFISLLNGLEIH